MSEAAIAEVDHSLNGEADGAAEWEKRFAEDDASFRETRKERGSTAVLPRDRDANGKFTSANEGQRAGQGNGKPDVTAAAGTVTKPAGAAGAPSAELMASGLPDGSGGSGNTESGKAGKPESEQAEDESKLSPYERARRREAKTWKQINETKAELELQKAEIAAERSRLEKERAADAERPRSAPKYSRREYLEAASGFEARARQHEEAGRFEEADRDLALAKTAREEAARGGERGEGRGAKEGAALTPQTSGPEEAWKSVKQQMPELLDPNSPLNRETVALIKAKPEILKGADGPYRAVLQAGRSLVAKLETEAGKVPALTQQVEALTKQVAELRALTSLPGGGGPTRLGGGGAEDFASMPADKREAELKREIDAMR